ncbi:hypothetical protein PIB30_062877 [Stylosanthes scabra]|uniref:Uncharacterized protein n=1 Tax=Stylosanthes scabra TaxID=79078 RepID=A0ABU6UK37_9FABA|nr:hypothetical protein [Stylosanthes scabra]
MKENQKRFESQLSHITELLHKFTNQPTTNPQSQPCTSSPLPSQPLPNPKRVEEELEKEVDNEVVEEETKGGTFFIATIFSGNEVKETEMPVKCEDPGLYLVTSKIRGVDISEFLCYLKKSKEVFTTIDASIVSVAGIAENVMVNIGKLTILTDFHVVKPTEGDKGGRPQVLLGRPFLKTARFKLQYDDDTFSLSVGKITEVFYVTRPPAPQKKDAHQLRVGSRKIEPEKLLRNEERKESENPKNDAFIEKGLRIAPPQLKKKRKKVPLNLERKKEKNKKKQEEGKSEKKVVLQCSSFDKLLGKLKIFKKILHHHKSMDAHLVKDNSKWK